MESGDEYTEMSGLGCYYVWQEYFYVCFIILIWILWISCGIAYWYIRVSNQVLITNAHIYISIFCWNWFGMSSTFSCYTSLLWCNLIDELFWWRRDCEKYLLHGLYHSMCEGSWNILVFCWSHNYLPWINMMTQLKR